MSYPFPLSFPLFYLVVCLLDCLLRGRLRVAASCSASLIIIIELKSAYGKDLDEGFASLKDDDEETKE